MTDALTVDRRTESQMQDFQLAHYSAEPVTAIRSVEQLERPHFKPAGFWLSVDGNEDGWKEWCEGEEWGLERLACVHDVKLTPQANIFHLKSAADIDAFDVRFRSPIARDFSYFMIDWRSVAATYQGIIIAPYIWERRLSLDGANWYYAWDCASGCIWDASAIESITLRVE